MAAYFFLFQEEQARKHVVQVDLEELVPVIDRFFGIYRNLERFGEFRDVGVDKDGIRVSVDDLREENVSEGSHDEERVLTSSCRLSASSRVCVKISRPLNVA